MIFDKWSKPHIRESNERFIYCAMCLMSVMTLFQILYVCYHNANLL